SLEARASASAAKTIDDAAGLIVLGGAMPPPSGPADVELNEAADRMTEAVRLANRYPSLPIVFTGGKGELSEDAETETEAERARKFFEAFNIVPPKLKLEDKSRNTLENAQLTAKLLQPKPGERWVLLTSAHHMRRAKALFEAAGFQVLPWPV